MDALPAAEPIDLLIARELPAAARGDAGAYGRIVVASQNTVTAVALAITRDVAASEDIAQDAFLSAWQRLGRLRSAGSFLPWIRQITRHLALDHLRARRRQRPLDGEAAELAIAHAADPSATPMQRLIDDERDAAASELIAALPAESREVLLLYYREGQSSLQVAALLGLSDAAVRKRLSRARARVRDDLLQRFAVFARSSAPGAAFAVSLLAATAGQPAAAATVAGASVFTGVAGKSLAGSMGSLGALASAGSGLTAGLLVAWLCRRVLVRYADDPEERRAIVRAYHRYVLLSCASALGAVAVHVLWGEPWLTAAAIVAALVVSNQQMLVALPRVMDPLLARDAARHPRGAERRQLLYRLTFGVSGTLISNIGVIGVLAIMFLRGAG